MVPLSRYAWLAVLVTPWPLFAQQNDPPSAPVIASESALPGLSGDDQVQLSQLSDFHFATWVLIESDSIRKVDQWAEAQIEAPAVREFAKKSAAAHDRLFLQLRRPLLESYEQGDASQFDFGVMLHEIGRRLNETAPPVPRPPDSEASSQERAQPTSQAESHETPNRPRERRIGRRTDLRRSDNDRRRREVVESIRENLPRLLDELGESVDAADRDRENVGLAFIELKRQLGDRYATSMIDELKRDAGDGAVPAYLGIQLVSHLQLINTMTVAQGHASQELKGALQEGIEDARLRVQQARELMSNSTNKDRPSPPRP